MFSAPVMLGEGTRVFEVPGGRTLAWEMVGPIPGGEPGLGRIYRPRRPADPRDAPGA